MPDEAAAAARNAVLALLASREQSATVCPSEVARVLAATAGSRAAAGDWRAMMSPIHAAVDGLVADGQVRLSWKGKILSLRTGPYRIGRATFESPER